MIFKNLGLPFVSFAAIILAATLRYEYVNSADLSAKLATQSQQLAQANSDNELLAATILTLADEVQLREDITSVIIDASRMYNVPPMLLTQTIRSESSFRPNVKHSIPTVECMSGINTKAHPKTFHNPTSLTGCVYASAEILSKYISDSDGLTLALTKYKGFSPLGHTQAKQVIKAYYDSARLR